MKRPLKIMLVVLVSVITLVKAMVLLYVGESLYVSREVYEIVRSSYDSYGESNKFHALVSDDVFQNMCYRNGYIISSQGREDVKEINRLSFPITFHWILGGKTTYWYSYEIYDQSDECQGGSWHIPVTITYELSLEGLKFTEYYEPP